MASGHGRPRRTTTGRRPISSPLGSGISGFEVDRQSLEVPAGSSWGVPVPAGRTQNVVATQPGFRPDRPHRLIGAHLDTVPQAPGRGGQRIRHRCPAGTRPDRVRAAARGPRCPRRVRRRGAPGERRRAAPLRVAPHGRRDVRAPAARRCSGCWHWTGSGFRLGASRCATADWGRTEVREQLVAAARARGHPDPALREPHKRPLVVREGRRAGGPARRHRRTPPTTPAPMCRALSTATSSTRSGGSPPRGCSALGSRLRPTRTVGSASSADP